MFEVTGKYTTAKVMIDDVEESCVAQINHFVNHPAFTNPIAIMPDIHTCSEVLSGLPKKALGGGNHFTELGLSDTEDHWVTIHTGSRNFGKCICEYWQGIASKSFNKETHAEHLQKIEDLKNTLKGRELFEAIKTLKGLRKPGIDMKGGLKEKRPTDIYSICSLPKKYAEENRLHIAHIICDILGINPTETIETVHNFIDFQDFIIRKGSIRSYVDERVIIPFNMRDGILICEGKSNPEWNCSAPHGAGRLMSRGQAKREINLEEFKDQMKDIYSTSVGTGTLDEAPGAYKPARIIEEAIGPTATIIGRIKPILNMKDSKGDDN